MQRCRNDYPNASNTDPGWPGGHSIGVAWGDFDNDGRLDLFAGNFAHDDHRGDQPESRFLRNQGSDHDYRFEDMGQSGVWYQESYASWAAGEPVGKGSRRRAFKNDMGCLKQDLLVCENLNEQE